MTKIIDLSLPLEDGLPALGRLARPVIVHGSVKDIFVGVAPFVVTMLLFIVFITFFPKVVTWLPNLLFN